ncbi:MAG: phosphonate C-P lyase system protein PhnG [Vallitaleaceae bacterium]|nr:phosphonate C-P lyase system protein PhnG [Vallitaleaceae bacterium]
MNRKQRTEILCSCDLEELKLMSNLITKEHQVSILEKANSGLVMVKMRESAMNHLFYLGEVFVTECKVMIGKSIGLGIIRGSHPKKAYHMAIIDAAYNGRFSELVEIDEVLVHIKKRQEMEKRRQIASLLKTKVDFITLDEEVKA